MNDDYTFYKHILTCTRKEFYEIYDDTLKKAIQYSIISPYDLDDIIKRRSYDLSIEEKVKLIDFENDMSNLFDSSIKTTSKKKIRPKRPKSKSLLSKKTNELDEVTNNLSKMLDDFADINKKLKI